MLDPMPRLFLLLLLVTACAAVNQPAEHAPPPRLVPALAARELPAAPERLPRTEVDARFTSGLLQAAAAYRKWGRVDEVPNMAPELCRAPMARDYGRPSQVRQSAANGSPHDRKLYYLWASDREAYLRGGDVPVGFTIVKESWTVRPATGEERNPFEDREHIWSMARYWPPIATLTTDDGERLAVDQPSSLYVMTKVGPRDLRGTDEGWVYGTLTPDGALVTSAGRVAQCMSCHDSATHGRLFGLRD
jgi:hypothetical protein